MSDRTHSAGTVDYYNLLGVSNLKIATKDLPQAELKRAYKRALLSHHPDKKTHVVGLDAPGPAAVTIDDITLAYQTLSDPIRRAEYDRLLEAKRAERDHDSLRVGGHHVGIEIVDLEDLDCDEEQGVWSRSCRCGSQPAFVVSESQLEENASNGEVTVGCKGCSLWLKILFSAED